MTIGIFGGSFNPPHAAHQLVALYVLETQPIDELWFVPTYVHPFGKQLAPYEHRIAMCELAAGALGPRVKVSRAEEDLAHQPGFVASRTLDLLELLRDRSPAEDWRFVIGADILGETDKWHRWPEIVALAPPIVVGRPRHAGAEGLEMPEISATRIRELLGQLAPEDRAELARPLAQQDLAVARELRSLLPRSVLWYIARLGLYV